MIRWCLAAMTHWNRSITWGNGATVAASTVGVIEMVNVVVFDEPDLWEIVVRILKALVEVMGSWPEGTPVNAVSLLIAVFKAADLVDVGAKVEGFLRTLTQAPPLDGGLLAAMLWAATIPMWILFLLNFFRYVRAGYKILRDHGSEDVNWDRQVIVDPVSWGATRVAPFLLIGGSFPFLGALIVQGVWYVLNSFVQVFYTGAGVTMSGVAVEIFSRMAEGLGIVGFILGFLFLFAGIVILLIVYLFRLLRFVWSNVVFMWDATRSVRGKRGMTLVQPAQVYLERLAELVLTAFFILLAPLIVVFFTDLNGVWIFATLIVTIAAAIILPFETVRGREYYDQIGAWLDADIFEPESRPSVSPAPSRPSYVSRTTERATRVASQAPAFAAGAMTAAPLQSRAGTSPSSTAQSGAAASVSTAAPYPLDAILAKIPAELVKRRDTLHSDRELNNAMFAWLVDTYVSSQPMRPLSDLIRQAESEMAALRYASQQSFDQMVLRGALLRSRIVQKGGTP